MIFNFKSVLIITEKVLTSESDLSERENGFQDGFLCGGEGSVFFDDGVYFISAALDEGLI